MASSASWLLFRKVDAGVGKDCSGPQLRNIGWSGAYNSVNRRIVRGSAFVLTAKSSLLNPMVATIVPAMPEWVGVRAERSIPAHQTG